MSESKTCYFCCLHGPDNSFTSDKQKKELREKEAELGKLQKMNELAREDYIRVQVERSRLEAELKEARSLLDFGEHNPHKHSEGACWNCRRMEWLSGIKGEVNRE